MTSMEDWGSFQDFNGSLGELPPLQCNWGGLLDALMTVSGGLMEALMAKKACIIFRGSMRPYAHP